MPSTPPVVLAIAGFDPSSGAGVTADIKTIAAHGCYGVACITALTVQSTIGVNRVLPTDGQIIKQTLDCLATDSAFNSVKVGMLGSAESAAAVASFLESHPALSVILDPIIKSSSRADLIDAPGVRILIEKLIPRSAVLTPNIDEAAALTGLEVNDLGQMRLAANRLHEMGADAVVVTGGHLEKATDLLSFKSKKGVEQEVFKSQKLASNATHGTGCAFSTAIACHLARGRGLPEAVMLAKIYVASAIANAYPLGKGTGPINHLYRMNEERRGIAPQPEPIA